MPDAEVDKEPEGNDTDKNKSKDKSKDKNKDNSQDLNGVDNADNSTEPRPRTEEASPQQTSKSRSVSFNRDVHVKRIGKGPRWTGTRGGRKDEPSRVEANRGLGED